MFLTLRFLCYDYYCVVYHVVKQFLQETKKVFRYVQLVWTDCRLDWAIRLLSIDLELQSICDLV